MKAPPPVAPVLSESIPKFYFPLGRPQANLNVDGLISKVETIFAQFPGERASIEDMGQVAKVSPPCGSVGYDARQPGLIVCISAISPPLPPQPGLPSILNAQILALSL